MSDTALLLLDYQVALCDGGPHGRQPALAEQVATRNVLTNAGEVLTKARDNGMFVIHVRLAFDPSYRLRTNLSSRFDVYERESAMLIGSPEAEFMPQVAPLVSEPIVTKGAVDAFVGTPLHAMLSGRAIRNVVLAGVATNLVVEATARHATDLGFSVTVLEDCCASFQEELHTFAIDRLFPLFSTVTTSSAFLAQISPGE
jgi:nicotinamidase-related amidase